MCVSIKMEAKLYPSSDWKQELKCHNVEGLWKKLYTELEKRSYEKFSLLIKESRKDFVKCQGLMILIMENYKNDKFII